MTRRSEAVGRADTVCAIALDRLVGQARAGAAAGSGPGRACGCRSRSLLAFLAVSWLGLWLDLPPSGRRSGLALFGLALLGLVLARCCGSPAPAGAQALDRLDRDAPGGASARPAPLEDTLALGSGDPGTAGALGPASPPRGGGRRRGPAGRAAAPGHAAARPVRAAGAPIVAAVAAALRRGAGGWRSASASAFDWRGRAAAVPALPGRRLDRPAALHAPAAADDRPRGAASSACGRRSARRWSSAHGRPGRGRSSPRCRALQPCRRRPSREPDLRETRYKLTGGERGSRRPHRPRGGMHAHPRRHPGPRARDRDRRRAGGERARHLRPQLQGQGRLRHRLRRGPWSRSADARGPALARAAAAHRPDAAGRPRPARRPRRPSTSPTIPGRGARVRLTLAARDEAEQEGRSAARRVHAAAAALHEAARQGAVEQRRADHPRSRRQPSAGPDGARCAADRARPVHARMGRLPRPEGRRPTAARRAQRRGPDRGRRLALDDGAADRGRRPLGRRERQLRAAQERLREAMERGATERRSRAHRRAAPGDGPVPARFAERMQHEPAERRADRRRSGKRAHHHAERPQPHARTRCRRR